MTQPTPIKTDRDLLLSQLDSTIAEYKAARRHLFHLFAETEDEADSDCMRNFRSYLKINNIDFGCCRYLNSKGYLKLFKIAFEASEEKFIYKYCSQLVLVGFFEQLNGLNARIKFLNDLKTKL